MAQYEGVLEIDSERGVIYFHLSNSHDITKYDVITLMRIQGLPKPIPQPTPQPTRKGDNCLDIHFSGMCSWKAVTP